ncbi:MAG: hypothetical protein ACYCSN_20255 [Acidobacteriaceae bacterium]
MNEDLYGTDILMAVTGDIQAAPGGDLALVTDIANLDQANTSRLLTTPDEYLFGEYGCTLKQYVDVNVDAGLEAQIQQDITASLLEDPRNGSVPSITVTTNGLETMTISLSVVSAFGDSSNLEVSP